MKIAFWSFYEENCKNLKMFFQPDADIAQGIFKKWNTLYDIAKASNIDIIALDQVNDFTEIDYLVFSDFPRLSNRLVYNAMDMKIPKILIIEEGPLIHSENWKLKNHKFFDYIYTWNDELIDNIKYFKFNVHYVQPMLESGHAKRKLCVLIGRNKRAWGSKELYSERRKAIRYFESNHPESFDLFGEGWNHYYFPSNVPGLKLLNGSKMRWLRSRLRENYSSWRGSITDKIEVMKQYKFSICYENSIGPIGYISEKIWDSFAAGTVPIYYGAPNVKSHIPSNCFIDFRDFQDYQDLYSYIIEMSDKTYFNYIENIRLFLESESQGGQFTDQYFADNFVKLLIHNVNLKHEY